MSWIRLPRITEVRRRCSGDAFRVDAADVGQFLGGMMDVVVLDGHFLPPRHEREERDAPHHAGIRHVGHEVVRDAGPAAELDTMPLPHHSISPV